jgi:hypothetical protein
MAITHELIAVTGEYKTKTGEVKTKFQKCGVAMDNKKGGTSLLIEALPVNFDGWLHMRLPSPKTSGNNASQDPTNFEVMEDDIPF